MIKVRFNVWRYDLKCTLFKCLRTLQNFFKKRHPFPKHLFVLCPTYCGSTLLQELLSTSKQVSPNNIFGTREGQGLKGYRDLTDYTQMWERDYHLPWKAIKKVWYQYWDLSKPILLDKSPTNILRLEALDAHFENAHFLVMVRNPYAHCESLVRRDKMTAEAAANFAIFSMKAQLNNKNSKTKVLYLTYESLVTQTTEIKSALSDFLPEIDDIGWDKRFKAHNYKNKRLPLMNLNEAKIKKLTDAQIEAINSVFIKEKTLLNAFGYDLVFPKMNPDVEV